MLRITVGLWEGTIGDDYMSHDFFNQLCYRKSHPKIILISCADSFE